MTKEEKRKQRSERSLERKLRWNESLKKIFLDESLKKLSIKERLEKLSHVVLSEDIAKYPQMKQEIFDDLKSFMDTFWELAKKK